MFDARWLIRVKPIPDDVRPLDFSNAARAKNEVYLWVTVAPEVMVHQWAIYTLPPSDPKLSKYFGRDIPSLHREGLKLVYAYVNCYDSRTVMDELHGRSVRMPLRVLHGNGNFTSESKLSELVINPKSTPKTFSPDIPAGYHLQRASASSVEQAVTGGERGSAARVREISQEARALLGSEDSLRAPPSGLARWVPALVAVPIALGIAALLVWLIRRRKIA